MAAASASASSSKRKDGAKIAIMWFRRDLRIIDNTALEEAIRTHDQILPLFVFTPTQISEKKNEYKSNKSVQFMIESLLDLEASIERVGKKGASLLCLYGEPETVIPRLAHSIGASAVYFNADYTPYSKKRDEAVTRALTALDISTNVYHDVCLTTPGSITTGGKSYQKYTPFYMRIMAIKEKIPRPVGAHRSVSFLPLDEIGVGGTGTGTGVAKKDRVILREAYTEFTVPSGEILVNGGRENGEKALAAVRGFKSYGDTRNDLSVPTTQLSAYLKYGCVSVREAYWHIARLFGLNHDLIRQLVWRDFYIHLLDAFPHVIGHALKPAYDGIQWRRNKAWLDAWKEGRTGFPIVDAGMRQLATTGFMHNRARMITASFLIKTLLIDWREGEKHFAQSLVDYDPAANNGNWQWVAGTGADSQPYFRVFNPWLQGEKHDADAEYIRLWVPELRDVDVRDIHRWHRDDVREKYAGKTEYPAPIVVFEEQRTAVLEMYKKALK